VGRLRVAVAVATVACAAIVGLNHAVAAAYRGDLYVMGGYASMTGLSGAVARLYRYHPARDRWSRLADAPSARAAHALGVIGGRLYVAGGARDGRPLDNFEIYDFSRRRWSRGPRMLVVPAPDQRIRRRSAIGATP
jgi:hypothetical protein